MEISLVDPHRLDVGTASELADISNAADLVDAPQQHPVSGEHVRLRLRHGWDNRGTDHLLLARDHGALVGYAEIELPYWDNLHMGYVDLQTHPDHRGTDVDDALLSRAERILSEAGRTLLIVDAWADSHRAAFWTERGLELASPAVQRRLVMADLDWPRLNNLLAESEAISSDYDIVEISPPSPRELIPRLVEVHMAINDAPLDDLELEDDRWTEERLLAFEQAFSDRRIRLHRLLARRRSDAAFGGHTLVAVEADRPWRGSQEDTAVMRSHRGHRLGLRLKIEMLRLLAKREPQVELIDTWNAESNAHMIAVNEMLGAVVVGRGLEFQKHLQ